MAQSDEGKNSLAQGKKRYACNSSEHQIKESTKKRNILVKYKERGYTYSERELKEMMEEHGKVKNIKSRKSSYGSSFNKSMICYNDEQQAETATVEINKFRGWTAELYQSYCQKQNSHKQNNIQQQEAKENNTKSNRQSTSERSEIDRLKEDIQQQKEEIKALKQPNAMTREHRKSKESRAKEKKIKARRVKRIKNALKHFTIFYQNIRRINSEVDSLTETVDDTNPTIKCLVETHMLKEEENISRIWNSFQRGQKK